jgi:hypothetical protein
MVLVRFSVRVMLLMAFSAFARVGFGKGLAALSLMSIVLCFVVATMRREPVLGPTLNHWDETVAFGALFALVSVLNQSKSI